MRLSSYSASWMTSASRPAYWMARCPAHDDAKASLSVKRGTEQPVLLHCFAECERDAILAAIGLTLADISKPRQRDSSGEWTPFGDAIVVYDYTDEHGMLLFQVCRTAGKQFPQRHPDPAARSGWAWNLKGIRRVPYRLPRLIKAVADGRIVYIAEGEKDVHALEHAGAVATTNPGGAGKLARRIRRLVRRRGRHHHRRRRQGRTQARRRRRTAPAAGRRRRQGRPGR